MNARNAALAKECQRYSEGCLYTSTSLFIWLRVQRGIRTLFIATPIVLGSLATWSLLAKWNDPRVQVATAVCSFIAGLLPALYAALKYDDHLGKCEALAGEFKNLQDRFRQAALVSALKSFGEFEKDVEPLVARLEKARSVSYTAPEWCFRAAQRKVGSGDYTFNLDINQPNEEDAG